MVIFFQTISLAAPKTHGAHTQYHYISFKSTKGWALHIYNSFTTLIHRRLLLIVVLLSFYCCVTTNCYLLISFWYISLICVISESSTYSYCSLSSEKTSHTLLFTFTDIKVLSCETQTYGRLRITLTFIIFNNRNSNF